jgi:hypothetical protein
MNKSGNQIRYYRKGYMAPGCNLYTSIDLYAMRHQ